MTGEEIEHVVEKRDRSAYLRFPPAVNLKRKLDPGLVGDSFYRGLTGHDNLLEFRLKAKG